MKENRGKNERQAGAGISRLYLLLAMLALSGSFEILTGAGD